MFFFGIICILEHMILSNIQKPSTIKKNSIYNNFLEILALDKIENILDAIFIIKENTDYFYLNTNHKSKIIYEVLNCKSQLDKLKALLKINNAHKHSTITKAKIIAQAAQELPLKECSILCQTLNIRNQEEIVRSCIKLAKLPESFLKLFQNNYSVNIKQLSYFLRYDHSFLVWFTQFICSNFSLSFSQLNIFSEQLYALQKRSSKLFDECVTEIKSIDLNTKDSQIILKNTILEYSYPTLTSANNKIQEDIDNLKLSKKITITWDKSLENKGFIISLTCNKAKDMKLFETIFNKEKEFETILKNFKHETH